MGGVLATGSDAWRVAAGTVVGGAAGGEVANGLLGLAGEVVEEGDEEVFEAWLRRPKTVPSTTTRTITTKIAITSITVRRLRCLCDGIGVYA